MTLQKTFIVWLTGLVVVIAAIVIALISGREASKLTQQLERERQQLGGEIVALLTLTDNLMQAQVKSSMRLLNQRISQSGAVSVGPPVDVAGRRVNDLVFNGTGQANRFELVDAVTDIMGGTATLFSRDNNDFVRISTNVITNNNRAIGTVLDPNGLAIAAIRRGTAFYGVVDILGNPFVTGYEPVTDSSNNVIGISYVGYRADLEALNRIVMQSRLLSQGFVAIEDRSGKVRVNSDNIAVDAVQQILAGQNDGWQQQTLEFAPWGYKVHLVYSETERNGLVWQTLRSLIVLVVVFFVTSSDSGSLVIDTIAAGGKVDVPVAQRVFWCTFEGLVAIALVLGGGLVALQAMAVSTGFPFALVLLASCVSVVIGLRSEPRG